MAYHWAGSQYSAPSRFSQTTVARYIFADPFRSVCENARAMTFYPKGAVSMEAVFFTALLIMLIGLIGCAVPAMPGLPIIWLGALFFAWQTDFQIIGWPMLALLFILMAAGATSG